MTAITITKITSLLDTSSFYIQPCQSSTFAQSCEARRSRNSQKAPCLIDRDLKNGSSWRPGGNVSDRAERFRIREHRPERIALSQGSIVSWPNARRLSIGEGCSGPSLKQDFAVRKFLKFRMRSSVILAGYLTVIASPESISREQVNPKSTLDRKPAWSDGDCMRQAI
jgi:hypothetical protein